jgi:hypothetical protein
MDDDTRPAAPSAAGFFVQGQQFHARLDGMSAPRDRDGNVRSM